MWLLSPVRLRYRPTKLAHEFGEAPEGRRTVPQNVKKPADRVGSCRTLTPGASPNHVLASWTCISEIERSEARVHDFGEAPELPRDHNDFCGT
jgi:hypothetical protein